jgi:uncharacterized membrane protein
MKAQSLIFEHALLFTISVAIFVICFAIFNIYQSHYTSITINDQIDKVKDYIASHILKLYEKDDIDSSIILQIPRRIGDEEYKIELSNNGLNITTMVTGISKFSSLYNIGESINLTGRVFSMGGRFMIYKKENKIILM